MLEFLLLKVVAVKVVCYAIKMVKDLWSDMLLMLKILLVVMLYRVPLSKKLWKGVVILSLGQAVCGWI
ncbi:Uncharacterised protein [Citrobacter werkmanii]|nr:Uncharacterised protein [Citrobacter werkmanii]